MIELQAFRENAGDSAKLGKEGFASRSCPEFPPTSSPPGLLQPYTQAGRERTWPRRAGPSEPEPARPERRSPGDPTVSRPEIPAVRETGERAPNCLLQGAILGQPL